MESRRTRLSREYCPRTPRVVINVSGRRFVTHMEWLKRLPNTLLGSEIMSKFYDGVRKEYFFDRDPHIFRYILNYYCTGKLHASPSDCLAAFRDELEFFGISESEVEDCCWVSLDSPNDVRHHYAPPKIDNLSRPASAAKNLGPDRTSNGNTKFEDRYCKPGATRRTSTLPRADNEGFTGSRNMNNTTKWSSQPYHDTSRFERRQRSTDLRYPKSATGNAQEAGPASRLHVLFNHLYGFFIVLSIALSVLETVDCSVGSKCAEEYPEEFFAMDTFFISVFSLELLIRFFLSPRRLAFFRDFFNMIDLLAILPYYVSLLLVLVADVKDPDLEAFRILRVFRVMKLTRRSPGLRSLLLTIRNCYTDLLFMYFTFTLGIFLFASVLYYTERPVEDPEGFRNIADSSWYTCVTMMTTG